MFNFNGPNVDAFTCNKQDNQQWTISTTDGTIRSKHNGQCLTQVSELEVWAGDLNDGSVAVVLFNRGSTSAPITVNWSDIGFPPRDSATVRDLWARQLIGPFRSNYTSPNIEPHGVMMLKITLLQ